VQVAYAGIGWGATSAWAWDPTWDEEAMRAARAYLGGMAGRLRRAGMAVESRVVLAEAGQNAAATINATAEAVDADVVVVSTHALTGPVRTLLGSVTDQVVRTGRRGTLVIRRDAPFVGRERQPAPTAATARPG
jgi:nucleotide-binding universal stress UspA family protein